MLRCLSCSGSSQKHRHSRQQRSAGHGVQPLWSWVCGTIWMPSLSTRMQLSLQSQLEQVGMRPDVDLHARTLPVKQLHCRLDSNNPHKSSAEHELLLCEFWQFASLSAQA